MLLVNFVEAGRVVVRSIRLLDVHSALNKVARGALHASKFAFGFDVTSELIEGAESTSIAKFVAAPEVQGGAW